MESVAIDLGNGTIRSDDVIGFLFSNILLSVLTGQMMNQSIDVDEYTWTTIVFRKEESKVAKLEELAWKEGKLSQRDDEINL